MKMQNVVIRMVFAIVLSTLAINTLFAQQIYSTIGDGHWYDDAIWSLNGSDPCYCVPATEISDFDVVLSHEVTMTSNLRITKGGCLTIDDSGSLFMKHNAVFVESGTFFAIGSAQLGGLDIGTQGYAQARTAIAIGSNLHLSGAMDIQLSGFDTIDCLMGDLSISPRGVLNLEMTSLVLHYGDVVNRGGLSLDNASLNVLNGDIVNMGLMNFHNSGYLIAHGGTFDNKGLVQGEGGVNMGSGLIDNSVGDWTGVDWCAGSGTINPPYKSDCIRKCQFASHTGERTVSNQEDIQLVLTETTSGVSVEWVVANPGNTECYQVHRSGPNFQFRNLGEVSSPLSGEFSKFIFEDKSPLHGPAFYRVAVIDGSGVFKYSAIREINNSANGQIALHAYPNPGSQTEIFLQLVGISTSTNGTLRVLDQSGRLIQTNSTEFRPNQITSLFIEPDATSSITVIFESQGLKLQTSVVIGFHETYN